MTTLSLLAASLGGASVADELSDISNYREYSEHFSSAGQPNAKQLTILRDAGFRRIVYLAFTNSSTALEDEDQIVKNLGMDFVQIAVDWDHPTERDFYAFASLMRQDPALRTLLHCQVNFRAAAFSFLYRVIYEAVPVDDAKEDLNSVWQPNATWRKLIFDVLAENDISPECDVCDWSAPQMQH